MLNYLWRDYIEICEVNAYPVDCEYEKDMRRSIFYKFTNQKFEGEATSFRNQRKFQVDHPVYEQIIELCTQVSVDTYPTNSKTKQLLIQIKENFKLITRYYMVKLSIKGVLSINPTHTHTHIPQDEANENSTDKFAHVYLTDSRVKPCQDEATFVQMDELTKIPTRSPGYRLRYKLL